MSLKLSVICGSIYDKSNIVCQVISLTPILVGWLRIDKLALADFLLDFSISENIFAYFYRIYFLLSTGLRLLEAFRLPESQLVILFQQIEH